MSCSINVYCAWVSNVVVVEVFCEGKAAWKASEARSNRINASLLNLQPRFLGAAFSKFLGDCNLRNATVHTQDCRLQHDISQSRSATERLVYRRSEIASLLEQAALLASKQSRWVAIST